LQQLLREQVSIRDMGTILETLVEVAPQNKHLPHLVEAVRQALGRRLVQPLLDADGTLRVLVMEPSIEDELAATFNPEGALRLLGEGRGHSTPLLKRIADSLKQLIGPQTSSALPVLLCQSPARYYLRRWLEPVMPRITVISPTEIPPDVRLRSMGEVR
jgi:flagellar biosynthesis protein FlhA